MKIEIEVSGEKYFLSRLDTTIFERFIKWADSFLPDPVVEARELIKGFPAEIQLAMAKDALEQRTLRRTGQSNDIKALMSSPEGARQIIALLLQKNHPDLDYARCAALIQFCEEEHGIEYLKEKLEQCSTSDKKPQSK